MTTGELLAWARDEGRAHEEHYRGHTTTELNESDYDETAVRMVCDACTWTVAAGGSRERV